MRSPSTHERCPRKQLEVNDTLTFSNRERRSLRGREGIKKGGGNEEGSPAASARSLLEDPKETSVKNRSRAEATGMREVVDTVREEDRDWRRRRW